MFLYISWILGPESLIIRYLDPLLGTVDAGRIWAMEPDSFMLVVYMSSGLLGLRPELPASSAKVL